MSTVDASTPRVLPRCVDAERAVLGAMLQWGEDAIDDAAQVVESGDFWVPSHRIVFDGIARTLETGPVDTTAVAATLERLGSLEAAGGREALVDLLGAASGLASVPHHAGLIRDASVRRRLAATGEEIVELARDPTQDAASLLDAASERILSIAAHDSGPDLRSIGELAASAIAASEHARSHGSVAAGISTGFGTIDDVLGGMRPGELLILAARPSMGKTTLAINIADRIAEQGRGVLFLSLEMSAEQLATNLLACRSRVSSDQLRRGRMSAEDFARVYDAGRAVREESFLIQDPSELTPARLRAQIRRAQRIAPSVDLVIVDYLQLMHGGSKFESRQTEVAAISRSLKAIAKSTCIPLLAIAQLNRAVESRGKEARRPRMSDLRESGAIEQDADVVMLLHRESYYEQTEENREVATLIVDKNRNGATGDASLRFVRQHTRFEAWGSGYHSIGARSNRGVDD